MLAKASGVSLRCVPPSAYCQSTCKSTRREEPDPSLDSAQPSLPTKTSLPLTKERVGTMTYDYSRNGTGTLFADLNVLDGAVIGGNIEHHRHYKFARFLNAVDAKVSAGKLIHAMTTKHPQQASEGQRPAAAATPRRTFQFTPTSASG
jgi:hypothetical protein